MRISIHKKECLLKNEIGKSDYCIYGMDFSKSDEIMNVKEYENIHRKKMVFI
jgi:hypothetical protein